MRDEIKPYSDLIDLFLSYKIEPNQFEKEFFKLVGNQDIHWSESEYPILNKLCGEVDAFCPDPEIRGKDDIDEDELRRQCKIALDKLNSLNDE